MKERTWLGILLSFAAPCRGKMAGSVVLAILSVAGGFVPYLGVYQIIRLFLERQADWEGIVFLVRRVSGRLCRQGGGICPVHHAGPCIRLHDFWRVCAFRWRTG